VQEKKGVGICTCSVIQALHALQLHITLLQFAQDQSGACFCERDHVLQCGYTQAPHLCYLYRLFRTNACIHSKCEYCCVAFCSALLRYCVLCVMLVVVISVTHVIELLYALLCVKLYSVIVYYGFVRSCSYLSTVPIPCYSKDTSVHPQHPITGKESWDTHELV
jgi:hypothetical protein